MCKSYLHCPVDQAGEIKPAFLPAASKNFKRFQAGLLAACSTYFDSASTLSTCRQQFENDTF